MENKLKIKFDKEQMRRSCYFAVENEARKGTPLLNKDGSLLTKEQMLNDNIKLFEENQNFIKDAYEITQKSKRKI